MLNQIQNAFCKCPEINGNRNSETEIRLFRMLGFFFLFGLSAVHCLANNEIGIPVQNFLETATNDVKPGRKGSDEVVLKISSPVADFDAGIASFQATFINKSKHATSFSWDFGDGTNSSQANPGHVYQLPGIYPVSLTAIGPGGQDVGTKWIVIDDTVNN